MGVRDVTDRILAAWDDQEDEGPDTQEETPDPQSVETEQPGEEVTEEETPEEEEPEVPTSDEDDEEEEVVEDEEETPAGYESEDPEVQAFLNRYQGDIDKALKGAAELVRTLNRQGREKNELARRAQQLEAELQQRQALDTSAYVLSEEQRHWVDEALETGDPRGYVQAAVRAGEFDLARAVCEGWAQESPYEAMRASSAIDNAEAAAFQQQAVSAAETTVNHGALMNILVEHFPEMPAYEERMVSTLQALGEGHPLVQDAQSNDPETAARGIVGIYEIARASTATVKQTRERVTSERRRAADAARDDAVLSTGTASPAAAETPRGTRLTPNLTLEQLDAAFENANK